MILPLKETGIPSAAKERERSLPGRKQPEKRKRVLLMKASALNDGKGVFISSIGSVRDITDELGAELLQQPAAVVHDQPASRTRTALKTRRIDKFLGKAKSNYKKGLHHYYREEITRKLSGSLTGRSRLTPCLPLPGMTEVSACGNSGRMCLKSIDRAVSLNRITRSSSSPVRSCLKEPGSCGDRRIPSPLRCGHTTGSLRSIRITRMHGTGLASA
jgi:hypothetical protein